MTQIIRNDPDNQALFAYLFGSQAAGGMPGKVYL
jgi:hypothetical protein